MTRRLVTILWLLIAATVVIMAANAPHMSFWEFIIPGSDLWSWLAPLALFGTPLLLLASTVAAKSYTRGLTWAALVFLSLPVLGAMTIIIFPKQTGYYNPDDPDRQPGGSPWDNSSH